MKMVRFLALPALLLSAGCASVHVSKAFNGVRVDGGREPAATVEIENSGWFLLTCIPLASGDCERPNGNCCRWFRNTVKLENNIRILDGQMKAEGVTEVANLTSHRTDEKYLVFLLARHAYHTSAVLLKPLEEEEKK